MNKAQGVYNALSSDLKLRLPALAVVETYDSSGNPVLSLGTGIAAGANICIKVAPQSWPTAKDVLGLTATVYSPTVVSICTETNPVAAPDYVSRAQLLAALEVCGQQSCRVDWYESPNLTPPSSATMITAYLTTSWVPFIYFGSKCDQ